MNGHVFVSHGSDDRVQANELAAFIEAKGAKAWIAPRNVRPGQDYSEQLQEAIEKCSAFLVLVTDKANKSPYVRAEVEMAFSLFKPIFPVRMADIQPAAGLALFLKIRHWTDAFGPDEEANLARLAREVQMAAGVAIDPTQIVEEAEARAAAARAATTAPEPSAPPPPASPPAAPAYVAPPPQAAAPPYQTPPPPPAYAPPQQPYPTHMTVPTAPTVALPSDSIPVDPVLVQAAVGPNTSFYLDRWGQMSLKGSAISWNWPACLFNLFWFAYRKMWPPAAGVFVAWMALSLIGASNPQFAEISWLFSIGITFVTGAFGNYLYRQQTERLIEETAPLGRPAQLEALALRGGVSKLAMWGSIAAVLAASSLTVVATTGQNPRVAPPDTRPGNNVAPADNGTAPQAPPQSGIPGYDDRPQDGTQQPPQTGEQTPGTGEETPPDDGSFQQDEATQDEITQPQE